MDIDSIHIDANKGQVQVIGFKSGAIINSFQVRKRGHEGEGITGRIVDFDIPRANAWLDKTKRDSSNLDFASADGRQVLLQYIAGDTVYQETGSHEDDQKERGKNADGPCYFFAIYFHLGKSSRCERCPQASIGMLKNQKFGKTCNFRSRFGFH